MSDEFTREYSQRLGVLTGEQLQAALTRFGLGELLAASHGQRNQVWFTRLDQATSFRTWAEPRVAPTEVAAQAVRRRRRVGGACRGRASQVRVVPP